MKRILFAGLLCVIIASCTGPAGSEGPIGPEGPTVPGLYYVKIFQQGVYPGLYGGQVQASLYNAWTNAYYTNSASPIDLGWKTPGHTYRAVIKFDLSSLPSSKVMVDKAELILKTNSTSTGGGVAQAKAHKIVAAWSMYYAGWENSILGENWAWAGGDYDLNTITTNALTHNFAPNTTITLQLDPAVVQGWMMIPSTNYGLIIKCANENAEGSCQIYSSGAVEPSNRPMLKIWYYTTE